MENEISPKTLDDFVGNKISVEGIKKWAEEVKLDPYHPKRICFITGSSGTGKSVLAKLFLANFFQLFKQVLPITVDALSYEFRSLDRGMYFYFK